MDDKLTRKSQEALSAAIRQAASDGKPQVEPVHLLLALLKQADGTAQPLLEASVADVEIRGQMIHANESVLMWYPSANRDEEVFPDPFQFDITRHPNEHLAF